MGTQTKGSLRLYIDAMMPCYWTKSGPSDYPWSALLYWLRVRVDRMTSYNQGLVAVAYNGRYGFPYGCTEGPACGAVANDPVMVIRECEKKAPR